MFRDVERPTLAEISELLIYDPLTGIFTRRVMRGGHKAGSVAGWNHKDKCWVISVFGHNYGAHQLAWLFHTGDWQPVGMLIDHKNRNAFDNRIENLRLATQPQNQYNSDKMSGVRPMGPNWQARISFEKRVVHLGTFKTRGIALQTRNCVARILHGEFAVEAI